MACQAFSCQTGKEYRVSGPAPAAAAQPGRPLALASGVPRAANMVDAVDALSDVL